MCDKCGGPRRVVACVFSSTVAREIGVFDVIFALIIGTWLFALPARGSLVAVSVASLLYLMTTLGVGRLISTLSQTQQQAFLGGFLSGSRSSRT